MVKYSDFLVPDAETDRLRPQSRKLLTLCSQSLLFPHSVSQAVWHPEWLAYAYSFSFTGFWVLQEQILGITPGPSWVSGKCLISDWRDHFMFRKTLSGVAQGKRCCTAKGLRAESHQHPGPGVQVSESQRFHSKLCLPPPALVVHTAVS